MLKVTLHDCIKSLSLANTYLSIRKMRNTALLLFSLYKNLTVDTHIPIFLQIVQHNYYNYFLSFNRIN